MQTKIVKVGSSNAVIIPAQTMHERGWETATSWIWNRWCSLLGDPGMIQW